MKDLFMLVLFPHFTNSEFYKTVGNTIRGLQKHGVLTEIWTRKLETYYEAYEHNVIVVPFFSPYWLWVCMLIWFEARRFNILLLVHTNPFNPIVSIIFKLLNRKGIVYVRADMGDQYLLINDNSFISFVRRIKLYFNLYYCDVFSIEQKRLYELVRIKYPQFKNKIILSPNGYGG